MCGGDPPPKTERDIEHEKKFNEDLERDKDSFKNGPVGNRSITDCFCCLIFIAAIVGFCGASAYGWMNGDPSKLTLGWDSDKNGCGWSEKTKDYPYLYWPESPADGLLEAFKALDYGKAIELLNDGVCVKECPKADNTEVECLPTSNMVKDPNYIGCVNQISLAYMNEWGINPGNAYTDVFKGVDTGAGEIKYPFRYNTKKLYGFCYPDLFSKDEVSGLNEKTIEKFKEMFEDIVMNDKLTSYLADIAYAWKTILTCSVTAIVLGYIYMLLIKCMGGLIVWLSIILILVSLWAGGYYMYNSSEDYEPESDYRDWVKYAAYGIWGLSAFYVLCICCCFNAIRIGTSVYQTTADYVTSNIRIYLLPFVAYLVAGLWLAVWLVSAVYTFSIGDP